MWRYAEFLPLPEGFEFPNAVGGTPLVASQHLAKKWGLRNLYFKNDAVLLPFPFIQGPRRGDGARGRAPIRISDCGLFFDRKSANAVPRKPRSRDLTPAYSFPPIWSRQKY